MRTLSGKRRLGISLVEILVCLVIVATIWAISMPTMAAAKRASRKTECLSNLHQMGLAFNLYRDEQDAQDVGSRYKLGLPSDDGLTSVMDPFRCKGELQQAVPHGYFFAVPRPEDTTLEPRWNAYSKLAGANAVIVADYHHNDLHDFLGAYYKKLGLGLTLDGRAVMHRGTGHPVLQYDWWLESNRLP